MAEIRVVNANGTIVKRADDGYVYGDGWKGPRTFRDGTPAQEVSDFLRATKRRSAFRRLLRNSRHRHATLSTGNRNHNRTGGTAWKIRAAA